MDSEEGYERGKGEREGREGEQPRAEPAAGQSRLSCLACCRAETAAVPGLLSDRVGCCAGPAVVLSRLPVPGRLPCRGL